LFWESIELIGLLWQNIILFARINALKLSKEIHWTATRLANTLAYLYYASVSAHT
jgi:hypothetical protein